jgi:4-hydroxythreonine-4-phosphate dehydrogenase
MGDPVGVGPEITAKALVRDEVWDCCRPIVVGDAGVLAKAIALVAVPLAPHPIADVTEARFDPSAPDVLDLRNTDLSTLEPGKVSPVAGRASVDYVEKAVELALAGRVDAIATGPINKAALRAAGIPYIGHTELLAALTGEERVTTMLTTPGLRVVHVTRHLPLREVAEHITHLRVLETIRMTDAGLQRMGIPHRRRSRLSARRSRRRGRRESRPTAPSRPIQSSSAPSAASSMQWWRCTTIRGTSPSRPTVSSAA